MATIDDTRGVLVVRIVYDGPAFSGKTTSLRALAQGVGSRVECPAEQAGRTLFFDWVDYVGGLFDGRQIRCQIVSVPGQIELAERRKALLETADSVVLVVDSRADEWAYSLTWLQQTLLDCRSKSPPVGLVLQANKRDAADAVPREVMQESLKRVAPVALVPSVAHNAEGIREAFVLAVRLALDRVRALAASGELRHGRPDEDDPGQLLDRLRGVERAASAPINGAFAQLALDALEPELDPLSKKPEGHAGSDTQGLPEKAFVPDPMLPGGMIWPPVDGRVLLHEAASLEIRPARTPRKDWTGSGSGFRFHSLGSALFSEIHSARNELLEWARLHAANAKHLTAGRAVILADAGGGRLRLWQILRSEATLRERLASALHLSDPAQVGDEIVAVASQLSLARDSFAQASIELPCTLWTVGAGVAAQPLFVGLMPSRAKPIVPEPRGAKLLVRELSLHLRELRRTRVDYSEVVHRVRRSAQSAEPESPLHWLVDILPEV